MTNFFKSRNFIRHKKGATKIFVQFVLEIHKSEKYQSFVNFFELNKFSLMLICFKYMVPVD
ncbi:hypothetical protein BpHYR1_000624 [Brachionus plicatilis]|uniref:Uncharacterized protein n=1 Tax=Brachionus plicatilis TaxID=10195 RepID=A0A3M7Q1G1_BRAPC|nr:hypothetical protein BpHYR1_000624 [Brachionus plicatilis]